MTSKLLVGLFALLLPVLVIAATAGEAQAARVCPNGGYCPPGTCPQFNGGATQDNRRYACNVKNCSAKNCRH